MVIRFGRMSLRSKINGLVSLTIFFVLAMVVSATWYLVVDLTFRETGERALVVARTVAGLPEVVKAFADPDPSRTIQPLAEMIRRDTGAEFVVVSNLKLIRYSHPNPAEIGHHMVGEDNAEVLKGKESITRATGTLGYSVRGKAPVFDASHRQIGVVSTGFLVHNVRANVSSLLFKLLGIAAVALLAGLAGSYLLSGHVKRQILNMEPGEIAFSVQEQAAILEAIREGIIAVNAEGIVVSCNHEAKKMLGREREELAGSHIADLLPNTRLPEVLRDGLPQYDQPMVVGNTLAVVSRVPVVLGGKVIGAVSTFRDKVALEQIDRRLADIGRYVDTLRSQRHEFMNKLHLISGLIRMSDYDSATAVIDQVNEEYQKAMEFYLARIRDTAIAGILVGKTHRAGELGIQLEVSSESLVSEHCPHREVVVAVLGNAIENAFDALQPFSTGGKVSVLVREETDRVRVEVADSGPGVDPSVAGRIFEDGVTTKGEGRGLGLALVKKMVESCGGEIGVTGREGETMVRVVLPTSGGLNG
ncbi:sensor histidine kinase [Geomonas sp. Red32]|uniref:ATP-binding protein n=1 Tax=Geomonas sp. Red32 TaxID=2912856 RepID=UPI00202CB56F|nr:sensor histidine kinase [Geomonas sp. Red32]MCM0082557.1 sensor histidine kinase [Geomonas sp. Red32]